MRLGIMQPYFFPYLGYFSLIKHTDQFILFDPVQFIRHGWIERNRILNQNEGWLYIQIPIIKVGRDALIKDIRIDNNQNWKSKILAQLQHYKKTAPFYYKVLSLINLLFEDNFDDIVSLNKSSLEIVLNYLNIQKELSIFSQMDIKIEQPREPDEWALNICKVIPNVKEYWNPLGGESFFDRTKYEREGIAFKFHNIILKEYIQKRSIFEEGLSIIDVMMFNSPEEINTMLDQYVLS